MLFTFSNCRGRRKEEGGGRGEEREGRGEGRGRREGEGEGGRGDVRSVWVGWEVLQVLPYYTQPLPTPCELMNGFISCTVMM